MIADLAGAEMIGPEHIAKAIGLNCYFHGQGSPASAMRSQMFL